MPFRGLQHHFRRSRDGERGASLVEFVLILPLFALLLFGLIDFGLVFGGYITVQSEVNAAARAISINHIATGCGSATNEALCTVETYIALSPLGVVPGSVKIGLDFPGPVPGTSAGYPVIVCAQATLESTTGMTSPFLNGRTTYVSSEILLEQDASVPSSSYSFTNSTSDPTFSCSG